MQETQVQSLVQEDPLEKEVGTHSSILAWEVPWIEEPGRLQSMELQKSWTWLGTKQQQQNLNTWHLRQRNWRQSAVKAASLGKFLLPEFCVMSSHSFQTQLYYFQLYIPGIMVMLGRTWWRQLWVFTAATCSMEGLIKLIFTQLLEQNSLLP